MVSVKQTHRYHESSTKNIETPNTDNQVEIRTIEAATDDPCQPEQEGQCEEDVESCRERAAERLLWPQPDHVGPVDAMI